MRTFWILAIGLAVVTGCKREKKPDGEEHGNESHEEGGGEHKEGEPENLLHIDAEMMRDLRLTTTNVEDRAGGEGVSILGELGVNQDAYAEVGAPIPARVVRMISAAGDKVGVGQALVELQSVELGNARGEYLEAKARADLARQTLERRRGLAADKIVSERELQEAEAENKTAQALLKSAEGSLRMFGVVPDEVVEDPSRFLLRSPIAGIVIDRQIARGQVVDPAKPLYRVADLSKLWLTVHAFERDAIRIKTGAAARTSYPALPGRTFAGTVTLTGREVDATSRTIPVRIEVDNATGELRPGMSASAWVPLGDASSRVVAVPAASLQRFKDGWCVFIPHEEGEFQVRPVGRGRDLGGEVEVLSGLKPGETVVVDGAFLLKAEADKARGEGEHHDH